MIARAVGSGMRRRTEASWAAQERQPPWPRLVFVYVGLTSRPQRPCRHRHGRSTPGNCSNGSRPALRMSTAASSWLSCWAVWVASCPHSRQGPCPAARLANRGVTTLPQTVCRAGHGTEDDPGYGCSGSSPWSRKYVSADSGDHTVNPCWLSQQGRHAVPFLRTVFRVGVRTWPHGSCRQRQGLSAPGYGSSGSNWAARMVLSAPSARPARRFAPRFSPAHRRQALPRFLTFEYSGAIGSPHGS